LPAALRSIVRQTEPDFECIVVDDGSHDETLAVARSRADCDPRFVVVALPHRGASSCLNAGLERCGGAIVARMDADGLSCTARGSRRSSPTSSASPISLASGASADLSRAASPWGDGSAPTERWLNQDRATPEEVRADVLRRVPRRATRRWRSAARVLPASAIARSSAGPRDYDLVLRILASGRSLGVVRAAAFSPGAIIPRG
jgi:glycosyltransferase involved in cell wall biosynthesis